MLGRTAVVLLVAAPYLGASAMGITVCFTAGLFGLPCPGCGLTRATLAALHGQLGEAMRLHPLFPLLSPLYVYLLGSVAYRYVLGSRARPPSRRADRVLTALASVAIALSLIVWIARWFGAFGGPVEVENWIRR